MGWSMTSYLHEGARRGDVTMMLHAVALGADKNFPYSNDHGRTPLIQAILSVRITFRHLSNERKMFLIEICCCS